MDAYTKSHSSITMVQSSQLAFLKALPLSTSISTTFNCSKTNHPFRSICISKKKFKQSHLFHKHQQKYTSIISCSQLNENEDQNVDDVDMKALIEEVSPRELKWSEIEFKEIKEELAAIDELAREEDLPDDDPWPQFLRGAAYEHWGQSKLALAQYSLTNTAVGLRRVPELWERRAYNAFKIGDVGASNAYFDIAMTLLDESVGNELHFVHWFYDNFKNYVPKRNGPPAPLQRAICKYCLAKPREARYGLVSQIAMRGKDLEHSILWLLATTKRFSIKNQFPSSDLDYALNATQMEFDWNDRMFTFIKLFLAAIKEEETEMISQMENLTQSIASDEKEDIITNFYFALYHDAFTNDVDEREKYLDKVIECNGSTSPNNIEDFLYHVAKNRLTAPPGSENTEVPETTAR